MKPSAATVAVTRAKTKMKFTNIVEELDLPVPRSVAYDAWTQFEEFPSFMKKVENVEQTGGSDARVEGTDLLVSPFLDGGDRGSGAE